MFLLVGEDVVRDEQAKARFYKTERGYDTYAGQLLLTTHRVLFRADDRYPISRGIDTSLDDIKRAEVIRRTWLGIPIATVLQLSLTIPIRVELQVGDVPSWVTAIEHARAVPRISLSLAQQLASPRTKASSPNALRKLLAAERGFPGGFWHPEQHEEMRDVLETTLERMTVARAVIDAALNAASTVDDTYDLDEDVARCEQIARAVAAANEALKALGDERTLVSFDPEDPDDSHVLVTDAEARELAARGVLGKRKK